MDNYKRKAPAYTGDFVYSLHAIMLYCINEKKAIKLLETFEYKPKKYAERVNHVFEVLGLSIFECYDMTEKLYKEVKKIATEINNFLNEGEFR